MDCQYFLAYYRIINIVLIYIFLGNSMNFECMKRNVLLCKLTFSARLKLIGIEN